MTGSDPSSRPPLGPTLRTVVRAVVPAAEDLEEQAWTEVAEIVDEALAQRSAAVRRQLDLFVGLMSFLAFVRYGRRLHHLPVGRARSFFRRLERSPFVLIRRGFWGVRTLALMGFYGRPAAREAVGYRASGGGWKARGIRQDPWEGRGVAGPPEAGVLTVEEAGGPDA